MIQLPLSGRQLENVQVEQRTIKEREDKCNSHQVGILIVQTVDIVCDLKQVHGECANEHAENGVRGVVLLPSEQQNGQKKSLN